MRHKSAHSLRKNPLELHYELQFGTFRIIHIWHQPCVESNFVYFLCKSFLAFQFLDMMVIICSNITLDGLIYCLIVLNELEKVRRLYMNMNIILLLNIIWLITCRPTTVVRCIWLTYRPPRLCRLAAFGGHEIFAPLGNRIHVDTADLKACCCLMNELPSKITTPAAKINEKYVPLLAQSWAGDRLL